MANIVWSGGKQSRPQVSTWTVTAVSVGDTFTLTINSKTVVYTVVTGDTTTLAAAAMYALLIASTDGEFAELTYANTTTVVTLTGPSDGAPFTVSKTDGGANTSTLSTTTTPISPHDLNAAGNWVGGVLPANGDVAVFENSAVSVLYNLASLTAITATVIRRQTFTGTIGLPDTNANGYIEYRPTFLEFAGTSHRIEQADSDQAQQIRLKVTSGSASTVTITGTGTGGGTVGSECVEIWGQVSTSVVNVAGGSVAVAPNTAQTNVVATILATNATVRVGPSATVTTATFANVNAQLNSTITTLNMDLGGTVTVTFAAAITTVNIDAGTLQWLSTGVPAVIKIGSGGTLDLGESPASLAVTSVELYEGFALLDPAGRLPATTPFDFTRCGVQDGTLNLGTHYKLTKAAHS